MNRIKLYILEAYHELLDKVTWPSWAELQNSAVVVLIASALLALAIFGMDKLSDFVLGTFYNMF